MNLKKPVAFLALGVESPHTVRITWVNVKCDPALAFLDNFRFADNPRNMLVRAVLRAIMACFCYHAAPCRKNKTPPCPCGLLRRTTLPHAGRFVSMHSTISQAHGFPPDFPSPEVATGLLSTLFSTPGFYCVLAEGGGRIAGSNCLDERSLIFGVGPITVDPGAQNLGVGRKLMHAVIDRSKQRGAVGVRLVQAVFHNRSLSLYANLGFDIREPLSCMQGRVLQRTVPGCGVRRAQDADLAN